MNSLPRYLFLSACLFSAPVCFAANPSFDAFPAVPVYSGKHADVVLKEPRDYEFRLALRSGLRRPVNFAGHYILTEIGCGASCVLIAAIDASSGIVTWLPFTLCCWGRHLRTPLSYKADSDLLILHGQRDEAGGGGPHFFRLRKGQFEEIHER